MYWQLHLASRPIRHLHLLMSPPAQVAISEVRDRVRFYDLGTGAEYDALTVDLDVLDNDVPEERRDGLAQLKARNGDYLPFVELNASHLYVSEDGQLRLIHDLNAGLTLETDGESYSLDVGRDVAVQKTALDRELGSIVALTDDHKVHIFQQQIRMNIIEPELESILFLFMTDGGTKLILIGANKLISFDTSGDQLRSHDVHYNIGTAALSPDGQWLLIGDADHQLIRLYNKDLIPVRQQHAIDLLSQARPLQLFIETPSTEAPLVALDIADDGTLAFALAGVIGTSHIDMMTELPQQRLLL